MADTIDVSTIRWSPFPFRFTAGHVAECEAWSHLEAAEDLLLRSREWSDGWAQLGPCRYAFRSEGGLVAIATYDDDDGRLVCVRLEVSRG